MASNDNGTENEVYESGSTEIDYEQQQVRFSISRRTEDGSDFENTNLPDLYHREQPNSDRKCFNRKWIGFILVVFLIIGLTVTAILVLTRGDESGLKEHESESNTNDVPIDISTSTTSWTTPSHFLISQHDITSPALDPTTTSPEEYFLPWNTWTACSSTCGDGIRVRYRSCSGLFSCYENYKETQQCFKVKCPVYGLWYIWSSWTVCDVACGEGRQMRTRKCSKVNITDIDCVGQSTHEQTCSFGVCPDCSMTCTSGILNTKCSMCICNQTLEGLIGSSYHSYYAPLQDVQVSNIAGESLTLTDDFGQFKLSNVCLDTIIVFSKLGYIDSFVKLDTAKTNITLTRAELPYMIIEPQAKARLVGENVTMCCSAHGAPNITYYEWFKDASVLNETFKHDSSSIVLTNITKFDQGKYSCRANNEYGSIRSKEAFLDVQDSTDTFCEDSFEQKKMKLPSDCFQRDSNQSVLQVGNCNRKLCRVNSKRNESNESETCRDDIQNCCTASDFEIFDIQCKRFKLPIFKVISCGCGFCPKRSIKIVGTVFTYPSTEIVKFYEVYLNGKFETYTSSKGKFSIFITTYIKRIILNVLYHIGRSTTKVIDLTEGSTGTIYTTLYIVDVTKTVQIDPTRENIIPIGKIAGKYDSSYAELHVPKESFANSLLQRQSEFVNVLISFLDPNNVNDLDVVPGLLTIVNDRGDIETIESFGSFHVTVHDAKTKEVLPMVKNVSVHISRNEWDSDVFLYHINTISGIYELTPNNNSTFGMVGSMLMYSWVTIGRPVSAKSKCFFSVRVFQHSSMSTELVDYRNQLYLETVHKAIGSFKTYSQTVSPSSSCFYTICDNTKGYIEIWVSNSETQSEEFLLPADPNYINDIGINQQKQSLLQYSVTNGSEHLGIIFTSTADGPFYTSESACLASDANGFSFYFRGSLEDVFTFRPMFDIHSDDIEKTKLISQRVWYQRRGEGYRICYVKVKIVMQSSNNIKVRAASFGGTSEHIKDILLGIRESLVFNSSSICIEYKCSGTIDEQTSSGEYDFTRVIIATEQCAVHSYSQTLLDTFSDMNSNNTVSGNFTFYAPITYSPNLGIYSASTASGDIESAKAVSKSECRSGKNSDYSSDNPDIGVAVTFSCP